MNASRTRGVKPARYKHVRGLARGLDVLAAMNRSEGGFVRITELATLLGMHRTTVKRLLETLAQEGYVRRSESDERYVLTMRVRELSDGFTDDEWVGQAAAPVLGELLQEIVWPNDIATLDGDAMVIRETTHRFSPLAFHRAIVGLRLPLLRSAMGRAHLAFCPRGERQELLRMLRERNDDEGTLARNRGYVRTILDETLARGYAVSDPHWQDSRRVAAIAVPILTGSGTARRVAACLSAVYLERAVPHAQAARRFVPRLQAAAKRITERLARRG